MRSSLARSGRTALLTGLVVGLLGTGTGPVAPAAAAPAPAPAPAAAPGLALPVLQPRPADALVDSYGVVAHIAGRREAYGDTARVTAALTALGARHIRARMYGNMPEQWAAFGTLAAAGVRANLVLGAPDAQDSPQRLVDLIAREVPAGAVESIEGANEWNLSGDPVWPRTLRAHQAAVYRAVKGTPATAHLPVLAPSLGRRSGFSELGDLTGIADVGNAHLYPGGQTPSTGIEENIAAARTVVPGKPVVFTEAGYHNALNTRATHYPTTESAAGVYAPRLLLEHFARGSQRVYTYQLLDHQGDLERVDHESHFGLLRRDWSPKPAYTAMQNLLRLTADPGPAPVVLRPLDHRVTGGTGEVRQQLLQRRDGRYQLVLWRDVEVYDRRVERDVPVAPVPVQVDLATAATVTLHDPSRSSAPVASWTGTSQVRVPLTGNLVVVDITPTPASPTVLPGAVTALPAEPGDGRATVRWDAPTGGGAVSGYRVTASPGGASVTVPAVGRSAVLGGLTNGTAYTFSVTATGPAGAGPTATTAPVTPHAPPGVPTAVTAVPRDGAAVVSWAPPAGGPATGFVVAAVRGGARVVVPAGSTSARIGGLVNGTYYRFTVTATGPGGTSAASAPSGSVRPMPLPGAVRDVRAVPGDRSVQLSWTPPATGGPVRQYVVRGLPGGAVRTVGAATRSTRITGLTNGVAYTFSVTAVGASGDGPTVLAPPAVPRR